ncbi:MAG: hypothetical protein ACLP0J_22205 [Solirubrobacteraceae bacterium]
MRSGIPWATDGEPRLHTSDAAGYALALTATLPTLEHFERSDLSRPGLDQRRQ